MFTVCVNLVLDCKYVQFQIILSLLWSIIFHTSKVNPHLIQDENRQQGKIGSFVRGRFQAIRPVVSI